ncbi:MAG: ATP-binding protein, partial [Dehalococcoidia bacterium]
EANHFTPERVKLLTAIADGMGVLLENAKLQEEVRSELEHGRRRIEAYQAAAHKLALGETPTGGLQEFVDMARELLEARYGVLAVWDSDSQGMTWLASGLPPDERQHLEIPQEGVDPLNLVKNGGKGTRLSDISLHPKSIGLPSSCPPVRNFLGVPIIFKGRHSGTFYFADKEGNAGFSAEDERLLGLFAVLAGVHLENASLYEEVADERTTLAATLAGMTEGLVATDPGGMISYYNQAAEKLLGFTPGEAIGRSIQEALGIESSDFDTRETLDALLEMLRDGIDGPAFVELAMLRPEPCQLSMTVFPIPRSSGPAKTGLVVRDVTQERDLERRRNAFVSVASHELRTPMTTILGFTELLLSQDPPEDIRRQWLERIHRDSYRLAGIVDDMLNVSRIQSGKLAVTSETLSLHILLEDVVAETRPKASNHEIVVDVLSDVPPVMADRQKLSQVLVNLLENAIKYSPRGGLITISALHDSERQRVVVAVSDQGVGIAPNDQEHLFTTFHRIPSSETEMVGGTGLGLYIVKGLVELMQGEVWLESELGKGSTFLFSLPTVEVAALALKAFS